MIFDKFGILEFGISILISNVEMWKYQRKVFYVLYSISNRLEFSPWRTFVAFDRTSAEGSLPNVWDLSCRLPIYPQCMSGSHGATRLFCNHAWYEIYSF